MSVLPLAERIRDEFPAAGPLTPLLADPAVTDVLVNGRHVWVDRGAGLVRAAVPVGTPEDVRRLAQRLVAAAGRRLDEGCPFADARLPDGTRLHAVLPPIAVEGPYLSLRTFRHKAFSLGELVAGGTVSGTAAEILTAIVAARVACLGALNTGHEGGAGTLHANNPRDVPARLEALGLLGGIPRAALHAQLAAALQVVVHLGRTAQRRRVIEQICVLLPDSRRGLVVAVPAWHHTDGAGPAAAALAALVHRRGIPVPPGLGGRP